MCLIALFVTVKNQIVIQLYSSNDNGNVREMFLELSWLLSELPSQRMWAATTMTR